MTCNDIEIRSSSVQNSTEVGVRVVESPVPEWFQRLGRMNYIVHSFRRKGVSTLTIRTLLKPREQRRWALKPVVRLLA